MNHTTISTARYRVQLAPHLDLWMQGCRYGLVLREYRGRDGRSRCVVKLDRKTRHVRLLSEDLTVIE